MLQPNRNPSSTSQKDVMVQLRKELSEHNFHHTYDFYFWIQASIRHYQEETKSKLNFQLRNKYLINTVFCSFLQLKGFFLNWSVGYISTVSQL